MAPDVPGKYQSTPEYPHADLESLEVSNLLQPNRHIDRNMTPPEKCRQRRHLQRLYQTAVSTMSLRRTLFPVKQLLGLTARRS